MRGKGFLRIILAAVLLAAMFALVACGGNNSGNNSGASSVFGDIQLINQTNALNEVIGQRGLVTVDIDLLTDELLIEFWEEHINGSSLNFFTIDFGDGTGYVFPSSRNRFSHSELSNGGAAYLVGRSGVILDGNILLDERRATDEYEQEYIQEEYAQAYTRYALQGISFLVYDWTVHSQSETSITFHAGSPFAASVTISEVNLVPSTDDIYISVERAMLENTLDNNFNADNIAIYLFEEMGLVYPALSATYQYRINDTQGNGVSFLLFGADSMVLIHALIHTNVDSFISDLFDFVLSVSFE